MTGTVISNTPAPTLPLQVLLLCSPCAAFAIKKTYSVAALSLYITVCATYL